MFPLFAAVAFAAGNEIRKFGFMEDAAITAIQALAIKDLAALVVVGVYGVVIGMGIPPKIVTPRSKPSNLIAICP